RVRTQGGERLVEGRRYHHIWIHTIEVVAAGRNAGAAAQSVIQDVDEHIGAGLADLCTQLVAECVDTHDLEPLREDHLPGLARGGGDRLLKNPAVPGCEHGPGL